jgi:hypothetical protein
VQNALIGTQVIAYSAINRRGQEKIWHAIESAMSGAGIFEAR